MIIQRVLTCWQKVCPYPPMLCLLENARRSALVVVVAAPVVEEEKASAALFMGVRCSEIEF